VNSTEENMQISSYPGFSFFVVVSGYTVNISADIGKRKISAKYQYQHVVAMFFASYRKRDRQVFIIYILFATIAKKKTRGLVL
jgi:hypothetical protein